MEIKLTLYLIIIISTKNVTSRSQRKSSSYKKEG